MRRLCLAARPGLAPQHDAAGWCVHIGARVLLASSTRREFNQRPTFSEITAALRTLDARVDMDPKSLKKLYMEMVKKHHPDKPGGCAEKMKAITTAYETLRSLSASERSSYRNQFSGGSSASAGAQQAQQRPNGAQASSSFTGRAAYDWQRMYQEQQRAREFNYQYTRGYHAGGAHKENPFAQMMGQTRWSLMRMPLRTLVFRAAVAYLVVAALLVAWYRRYRDWLHDDGWRSSESLSRKEQLDDLTRMRNEVFERLAMNPRFQNMMAERDRERQIADFMAAKARENAALQRSGYEPFHPSLGSLHREAQDPEGVVYFDPRVHTAAPPPFVPPGPSSTQTQVTNLPTSSAAYTQRAAPVQAVQFLRSRDAAAAAPLVAEGST